MRAVKPFTASPKNDQKARDETGLKEGKQKTKKPKKKKQKQKQKNHLYVVSQLISLQYLILLMLIPAQICIVI